MSCQSTCDIEDEVKKAIKQFRFNKSRKNSALIIKINTETQNICLDQLVEDTQIEDLQEILSCDEPRYILYHYKMEHGDGRISFPMCFIFYTPSGIQMKLQMAYASMKPFFEEESGFTRCYEVRDLEEFTEDWLKEKLER